MSVVCDPAPLKVAVAASVLGFSMVFLSEVICAVVQTRPVAYRRVCQLRLFASLFECSCGTLWCSSLIQTRKFGF